MVGLPINDYTYDLNDNRGTRVLNDASQDEDYFYTEDTNQITAQEAFLATGATLPVNPNRDLFYNDVGRLYELHEDGTRKAAFLYNDEGQRTRKTTYLADGITIQAETVYHYDAMGYLTTETQTDGTLIRDYIWSEGMHPQARIDNQSGTESIIYFTTDHLMTSRLATDDTQEVVWRWEGEAFGNTLAEQDPDGDFTDIRGQQIGVQQIGVNRSGSGLAMPYICRADTLGEFEESDKSKQIGVTH